MLVVLLVIDIFYVLFMFYWQKCSQGIWLIVKVCIRTGIQWDVTKRSTVSGRFFNFYFYFHAGMSEHVVRYKAYRIEKEHFFITIHLDCSFIHP